MSFDADAWSYRPGKGLHGAVARLMTFRRRHPSAIIWRGDVRKYIEVQPKNDILVRPRQELRVLGVIVFPTGIRLDGRNRARMRARLSRQNVPSFAALARSFENAKNNRLFLWQTYETISASISI
jgi:hypothetical protein